MDYCNFGYLPLSIIFLGLTCFHMVSPNPNEPSQYWDNDLKCHPAMTIEVPGETTNSGLSAYGYHFSEGYYKRINYTHYRICICKVTKCMRKCCGKRQALYNRTCVDDYDFPLHPKIYDENQQLLYNYDYSKFVTVYGDTCQHGRFILRPELDIDDLYYFLENGSLYMPNDFDSKIHDTEDFCLEHVLQSLDDEPSRAEIKAIICFPDFEIVTPLMPIGMIISTPFLLATFLVYSIPELRNLHGKNLMSHVGSLLVAYIILVVVQMASMDLHNNICIAFGYIIQYSFLSSFFWLNVMCFDIWWAFSGFSSLRGEKKSADLKKYLMYSAYAWGCPALISIATIVMQYAPGIPQRFLKPDIGHHRCFFTDENAKLAYFYGPTAVILLCDVVLFILTAIKILSVKKETVAVFRGKDSGRYREASKQRYKLYLKLFLIMGVNWTMEVISWAAKGPRWVWYFTDFTNSLQGVFIFVTFVCIKRVKRLLISRFCPHLKSTEPETNTSMTKSTSRNPSVISAPQYDEVVQMHNLASRKISS